jgi:hypothetical protein
MITIPNVSERQASFVRDMLTEIFAAAPAGTADAVLARNIDCGLFATRGKASDAITALIAKRDDVRKAARAAGAVATVAEVAVAAGYYAIERGSVLYFYRIVEGKGRWAGRTFVNRYKSDDEIKVSRTEAADVRRIIALDPEAARMRFARELTRCTRCGRMLTDIPLAESNGGYGPECVKKI